MRFDAVSSLGLVSNVGRDVRTACAAARAGISRLAPIEGATAFEPDELEAPIIGAPIVGLTDGFVATGSFVRLAHAALEDLIEYGSLPKDVENDFWRRTALVWSLPEATFERFMWPEDEVADILRIACAERLVNVSAVRLSVLPAGQIARGHVAVAEALSRIDELAMQAGAERVVLIATDSYMDTLALRLLLLENRVKSAESPAGLLPGEAGAALLLEESARSSSACGPQCRIVGTASMDGAPLSDVDEKNPAAARRAIAPTVGIHVAAVIASVLDQANCQMFTGTVFLDLNGEEWKAIAWALAVVQLKGRLDLEGATVEYPCLTFGELGAATAVVSICQAARAFARRYSDGDRALVLSIGDRGQVSAILIEAPA
jgi:3-oxoacyl-[acyl-carrier-protein] synthase-1